MKVGDIVQDFELEDETGTTRRLSEFLENGPVVLFFYPSAMTKGCTAESCHFRDLAQEFAAFSAQRVGISMDPVSKQKQFSQLHSFDYPLLSDPSGEVARIFGVKRSLGFLPVRRKTFVITQDFTVREIINSEIRMEQHADQALEALARIQD